MNLNTEIDYAVSCDESGLIYPAEKARGLAALFPHDWIPPEVGTIEQWTAIDFEWWAGPPGDSSLVTISIDPEDRVVWAGINDGATGKGQSSITDGLSPEFVSFAEAVMERMAKEALL